MRRRLSRSETTWPSSAKRGNAVQAHKLRVPGSIPGPGNRIAQVEEHEMLTLLESLDGRYSLSPRNAEGSTMTAACIMADKRTVERCAKPTASVTGHESVLVSKSRLILGAVAAA